jgi:ankyrin repeat protein
MSGKSASDGESGGSSGASSSLDATEREERRKEKARVSRTSLILWHTHQNDVAAVRKLLEEDKELVNARDYDKRTPLHVAALHGWIDVARCLLEHGAVVNAQDRWKNTVRANLFLLLFLPLPVVRSNSLISLLNFQHNLSSLKMSFGFDPKY